MPVAVLGSGMAGASVALELARAGVPVLLLEQDVHPFNRASLRNEGKIHLGLIYAHDASLATARLQLQGALQFAPLLRRWLGPAASSLRPSTPFHYLVARDSLLRPEALEAHYAGVQRLHDALRRQLPESDYLGTETALLTERVDLASLRAWLVTDRFAAAYRTAEIAVDTAQLAGLMRGALLAHPLIDFRGGHRVQSVTPDGTGFRVAGDGGAGRSGSPEFRPASRDGMGPRVAPAGSWTLDARQVVNCLWEDRLRIDRTAGLEPAPGWLHRLKYRVIARLPERLRAAPSVTMVLGPYGDVVVRADGTAYLSWYPKGLRGWSHDPAPPADWAPACRGEAPADEAASVCRDILAGIDTWYPGIGASEPILVDAGAIVSYGRTDVDDPNSGLHDRTRIGVRSAGGYHSLDPGKLTTAPLFGRIAAERVLARA